MEWINIVAEIVGSILPSVIKGVRDYIEMVKDGKDVDDHWVRKQIPDELRTEIQDRILTQARKDAGLPT